MKAVKRKYEYFNFHFEDKFQFVEKFLKNKK